MIALGHRLQEDDELGVPMAPVATPMDPAVGHLQRSEQAGGVVAQVIMGHAGGHMGVHYHNIEQLRTQAGTAEIHIGRVELRQ